MNDLPDRFPRGWFVLGHQRDFPGGETKTLVYKAYIDGFRGLDLGSAGAQSIVMMLIVLLITIFQFRYIEGRIHYN